MKNLFLSDDIMYEALVNRDSQYEGLFFVGVKTTGIFCRPTCHARKPKRENVEFFETTKEAITHGYRPCRLCHPLERNEDEPDYIKNLLQQLEENPDQRITDADLVDLGMEPHTVRRWFKKYHGMTFQAYQRFLRINRALGNIRKGETVTKVAFDSGYDSLSGFGYAFKKMLDTSPSGSGEVSVISITRLSTPLGSMLAGATDEGICLLEFTDRRMLEHQLEQVAKRLKSKLLPGNHPYFDLLAAQLEEYFSGTRQRFDLPLLMPGTEFQQKTWKALQEIPYGETRSYKEQALMLGNVKAVRAVAQTNGLNRLAIVVPCHRVIGGNGELTGYAGGIWRKQWLLEFEQKNLKGE